MILKVPVVVVNPENLLLDVSFRYGRVDVILN